MTNRTIFFFILLLTAVFAAACNQSAANKTNANDAPVTINAKPQPDDEIAVIETADYGNIKIELYSNIAPKHVARFKELAREGFYNRMSFHRVDPSLGIVQGGDPNSKDDDPTNDGTGSSSKPNLPAEFSDIPYDTGILGAARGADNNSANSQFFLMTKRQPGFDRKYTIYGKIIEGQDAVNLMSKVPTGDPTGRSQGGSTRPIQPLIIKTVRIEKR